jgi:hypothetical protein
MYWRWFVNQGEPRALRLGLFFLRIDARCLIDDFEVNAASVAGAIRILAGSMRSA